MSFQTCLLTTITRLTWKKAHKLFQRNEKGETCTCVCNISIRSCGSTSSWTASLSDSCLPMVPVLTHIGGLFMHEEKWKENYFLKVLQSYWPHTKTHLHTHTTELNTNKKGGCSPHVLDEQINNTLQKCQRSLIRTVWVCRSTKWLSVSHQFSSYADESNAVKVQKSKRWILTKQFLQHTQTKLKLVKVCTK